MSSLHLNILQMTPYSRNIMQRLLLQKEWFQSICTLVGRDQCSPEHRQKWRYSWTEGGKEEATKSAYETHYLHL